MHYHNLVISFSANQQMPCQKEAYQYSDQLSCQTKPLWMIKWVYWPIHTHTNPWGRLKWPSAINRHQMSLLRPGVTKKHKTQTLSAESQLLNLSNPAILSRVYKLHVTNHMKCKQMYYMLSHYFIKNHATVHALFLEVQWSAVPQDTFILWPSWRAWMRANKPETNLSAVGNLCIPPCMYMIHTAAK